MQWWRIAVVPSAKDAIPTGLSAQAQMISGSDTKTHEGTPVVAVRTSIPPPPRNFEFRPPLALYPPPVCALYTLFQ